MAKKTIRSLFGPGKDGRTFLQAAAEGFATGMGAPESMLSRNIAAKQQADALRQRATEADIARTNALSQEALRKLIPAEEVPLEMPELSLFGDAMQPEPPPPDPKETRYTALKAMRNMNLDPEGVVLRTRLENLHKATEDPQLTPAAREDLSRQFDEEVERARIVDHEVVPPTIDQKVQERTFVDEDGMMVVEQPDGNFVVDSAKAKLKVEQQKIALQEKTSMEQMQASQQQAKDNKAKEAQQLQLEAKKKREEEDSLSFQKSLEERYKTKSYDDRLLEHKKRMDAEWKAANPNKPFTPTPWSKVVQYEKTLSGASWMKSRPRTPEVKRTPFEALQDLAKNDHEAYSEKKAEAIQRLLQKGEASPSPTAVLKEMMLNTQENDLAELQQLKSELDKEELAASKAALVNTEPVPTPELDITGAVPATSLSQSPFFNRLLGGGQGQAQEPIVDEPTVVLPQERIERIESKLKEKHGKPFKFASLVDPELVGYFASQGSKDPIDDAAKVIEEAIEKDDYNLSLMSSMDRMMAKDSFPLAMDNKESTLDSLGIKLGEFYRDTKGNIRERKPLTDGPQRSKNMLPQKFDSKQIIRTGY